MKENVTKNNERNVSLDLLKIIGMFLIVCIHLIGVNHLTDISEKGSMNYYVMLVINMIGLIAVPCYLLISGYFLVNSKFNIKKILKIWAVTLFYSIINYFFYTIVIGKNVGTIEFQKSFFPVLAEGYWFVSVYVGLYMLFPFLNIIIHKINQNQYKALLLILFIINCVSTTFFPTTKVFGGNYGMNIFNAIFLYFVAAYIRLYYKESQKKHGVTKDLIIFIGSIALLSVILIKLKSINSTSYLIRAYTDQCFSYSNILCFLASVSIFIAFTKIKITNKIAKETVNYFKPLLFSVYLIHHNILFLNVLWTGLNVTKYANLPTHILVSYTIGISLLIFICCVGVELLRIQLFKLISKINFVRKINNKLQEQYDKINAIINI